MRTVLKVVGVLLVIVIATVVVLGLIAPNEFKTERAIVINAPQDAVVNEMFYFKNFNHWSPWSRLDPNMQTQVIGEDGKVGTVYEWKGNDDVGSGIMRNKFVTDRELQYEMNFKEPWESTANGYWRVEDAGGGKSKAVWGFRSPAAFPMNGLMMAMGMTKAISKDFDKGLINLKTYVEKNKFVDKAGL